MNTKSFRMKGSILVLLFIFFVSNGMAQKQAFYTGENGDIHLCGPFDLKVLETDTTYQKWFKESYSELELAAGKRNWLKNLRGVEVEIYLGTWCGDSKNWVPKFVRLWDDLGLNREDLHFTALYDMIEGDSKYKQGPNGEEKGKDIHRVPTFIFSKGGKEIARMVEYPVNDLETDLAQIALGYPSEPNYRGASYMLRLFRTQKMEEIKANELEHLYAAYRLIKGNVSELNTLGYVLLESRRIEEALLTLYFNTRYFPYNPNVYDSYGEALEKAGETGKALEMYEKVLLLDRSNQHAKSQIQKLRSE